MSSLLLVKIFVLKSILYNISTSTTALLVTICMIYIFYSFTFSVFVPLRLMYVSHRYHIIGSCFLICSANLCLLIGVFPEIARKSQMMAILLEWGFEGTPNFYPQWPLVFTAIFFL